MPSSSSSSSASPNWVEVSWIQFTIPDPVQSSSSSSSSSSSRPSSFSSSSSSSSAAARRVDVSWVQFRVPSPMRGLYSLLGAGRGPGAFAGHRLQLLHPAGARCNNCGPPGSCSSGRHPDPTQFQSLPGTLRAAHGRLLHEQSAAQQCQRQQHAPGYRRLLPQCPEHGHRPVPGCSGVGQAVPCRPSLMAPA